MWDGRLDAWAAKVAEDPEFAALIYRSNMQADMGGQLFVRDIEVPEAGPRSTALAAAAIDSEAFLALPFEEAIAAFLARRLITPEQFRQLSADNRARAFSVSRMTSAELVARVRSLLDATLEEGGTYRDFVAEVRAGEADLGITPTRPSYLEVIFRTNVQSSYGAGRLRQITSPEVLAARPFVEYRTAKDNRVRPTHAQLEGVVMRTDAPGWERFSPPLGFCCRCGLVTRRADQVDMSRVVEPSSLPTDAITPGFGGP